jgi:hypothetical protein
LNAHRRYLRTSLWLTLPPLAISVGLWSRLPRPYVDDAFWSGVPPYISVPENVLRVAAFALAALLPFGMDTRRQQRGMLVYLLGLCLYAGSYGAQILFPEAAWSQSAIGFLAPAWTPLLWFVGIGLMADDPYFPRWFRVSHFVVVATAFLAFHVAHVAIIFVRSR